jgi:hypothetical protein
MSADHERDEAAVLRESKPLVRAGTVLERVPCSADDTSHLHGGSGGSHLGGIPYLERDEDWPCCAHGQAMRLVVQTDSRDALHHPAIVGLFVVFACNAPVTTKFAFFKAGHVCEPCVRYYPAPLAERRREVSYDGGLKAIRLVPTSSAAFLPGVELVEKVAPTLVERLSGTDLREFWGRAYCRMMDHTGIARLLY